MRKTKAYTSTKETLGIFWSHSKRYPWQVGVLLSGILILTLLQTYIPLLYRDLVNILSIGASSETASRALDVVFIILGVNLLRVVLWRSSNFANNYFQSRVMSDLTNSCYRYLQQHSQSFFNSNFVGSLVTKVKRYERAFEQIADQVYYDLGRSLLETAIILGVLLWQYKTFGFLMLAWCTLFFAFSYAYSIFKLPYDVRRATADTQTTAQLADSVTNNVNVKLFASYQKENDRFYEVTNKQFLLRKKSWNLGIIGDLAQGLMMIAVEFIIIYLGVTRWREGLLNVGDVVLLQTYLLRIFDKLWNTGKNIQRIYEALADANEMTEILLTPHEVEDVPNARVLEIKKGRVEFRNISFAYHKGVPVLKNFHLTIAPGERVAFIGPSGGGKSTIAKLLFRFYDIDRGEILVDNQNIAKVTQNSLRSALALVPQEPILFHRTLMENIRYAKPDASDENVVRAAKLAHAHEFISSFPEGYNTLVGERGIKLSGGERQRVAIARAILKDAAVLVLDEATSSLDSESELYIQDALKELMKGRTTLVIAHRLSTIMQMDRIIVIDNGTIIEEGKHKELVKVKRGLYQKLWGIQAGGFAKA
ncbi:ABC transporter ATP-binding protein [Candidatus Parcubacteria bacterium]|nr:MAG: ABC transporter ATP-binding protein [Candidatus Parcubacteria bacterium]